MKFYIIHSCITRESCSVESKTLTRPLTRHLSLIWDDVLVCFFRDAEVLHFIVSYSLKIVEQEAVSFAFFGFWRY